MLTKIDKFKDKYYFLSNYYKAPVIYHGIFFTNNESAFQSAKLIGTKYEYLRRTFSNLPPNLAKRKGRQVVLRPDWEQVKDKVMYDIVKCKFSMNDGLKEKLLATGNVMLIEGNNWNDTYWGYDFDKKQGLNKLGNILMQVRYELGDNYYQNSEN